MSKLQTILSRLRYAYDHHDTELFEETTKLLASLTSLKNLETFKDFVTSIKTRWGNQYGYTEFFRRLEERDSLLIFGHRRSGKTSYILLKSLFLALRNPNQSIEILVPNVQSRNYYSDEINYLIRENPLLEESIEKNVQGYFAFKNGSRIKINATSQNYIFGQDVHHLFLDNASFLDWDKAQRHLSDLVYPGNYQIFSESGRGIPNEVLLSSFERSNRPSFACLVYSIYQNPEMTPQEIDRIRKHCSEEIWEQEYLCHNKSRWN